RGQRLLDHERRLLGSRLRRGLSLELEADVAVPAAAEQLRLVAEVPEDEVVAARPRVEVLEELPEEAPLARHARRIGRLAVHARHDQPTAEPDVGAGAEEQARRLRAVTAGAADLLVVRLDRRRRLDVDD